MTETLHIHPTAELAERVLLPGDPGRAFRLAQTLLEGPKMFNHHRGLWGYTGVAADGESLTIQSTGMGGPSCAIVVSELIALGAQRLVRIGTCGGLSTALSVGQLLVATEVIGDDGTSVAIRGSAPAGGQRATGGTTRFIPDAELVAALQHGDVVSGPVVSSDLFYDSDDRVPGWIEAGALAVEMEAATLLALAAKRGVRAACVLLVSNMVVGDATGYIDADALTTAETRLGEAAAEALGCAPST
jgi:DeoD family purine-nucleoside phosphorylase